MFFVGWVLQKRAVCVLSPDLTFELLDVMWGLSSVVLYYKNQNGTTSGEFMELDSNLKIIKVVANYSANR